MPCMLLYFWPCEIELVRKRRQMLWIWRWQNKVENLDPSPSEAKTPMPRAPFAMHQSQAQMTISFFFCFLILSLLWQSINSVARNTIALLPAALHLSICFRPDCVIRSIAQPCPAALKNSALLTTNRLRVLKFLKFVPKPCKRFDADVKTAFLMNFVPLPAFSLCLPRQPTCHLTYPHAKLNALIKTRCAMVQKALNNTSVSMISFKPRAVLKHSHTSERENRDLCIDRDQSKGSRWRKANSQ